MREFTKNSAISKDLFVILDFQEIIVPFVNYGVKKVKIS